MAKEGLIGACMGWARCIEEVVLGDSKEGYWRWGGEWDMLQRLASNSNLFSFLLGTWTTFPSSHTVKCDSLPQSGQQSVGRSYMSLLVLAHKILHVLFHCFFSLYSLDVDAMGDLGINVVKLVEPPPVWMPKEL